MAATLSRREAKREAAMREILDVTRKRLVSDGIEGVTMRPIAATVGLTAPGLYRYFSSRNQLLHELCAVLYDELAGAVGQARDAIDPDDLVGRLMAVTRAFRAWSLSHRAEFELLFAAPIGFDRDSERLKQAGQGFGAVFVGLFVALWFQRGYPVPDVTELAPELKSQLEKWSIERELPLPIPALVVFLECWVQVYGLISMEIFGQLEFALSDVSPMFETALRQLAARLTPPASCEAQLS